MHNQWSNEFSKYEFQIPSPDKLSGVKEYTVMRESDKLLYFSGNSEIRMDDVLTGYRYTLHLNKLEFLSKKKDWVFDGKEWGD